MTKKWYRSKALWLGAIVVVGGIAEYLLGLPPGVAASTVLVGVLGIIFRFLTKKGIIR